MTEIARGTIIPRIRQLSCFLENRVGALQRLLNVLEHEGVHLCAISIVEAAEHAVARIVVDRPSLAKRALVDKGYSVFETNVLGIGLPPKGEFGIKKVLGSILQAELNVKYVYSLLVHSDEQAILAVSVEDFDEAGRVVLRAGLRLVGQNEIGAGTDE